MKKKDFITGTRKQNDKSNDLVTFVFLSENYGHRMKSYGPLALIKIKDKTLLEKQIEAIQAVFLNYEIILCSGFETFKTVEFIKNKFSTINIRVVENQMHFNSNCCESIRLCLSNTMNDKIIISNGSVLFTPKQLSSINLDTCILTQTRESSGFEIGVIENDNRLENLSFGLKNKYWCEVFCLNGKEDISQFYSIISNTDFKNKFMFEAINLFSKKKTVFTNEIESLINLNNIKNYKGIAGNENPNTKLHVSTND